jgi:hypothetical protein
MLFLAEVRGEISPGFDEAYCRLFVKTVVETQHDDTERAGGQREVEGLPAREAPKFS